MTHGLFLIADGEHRVFAAECSKVAGSAAAVTVGDDGANLQLRSGLYRLLGKESRYIVAVFVQRNTDVVIRQFVFFRLSGNFRHCLDGFNRIFAVTAMFYEDITTFMELIQKQRFDKAEKDMKRKRRDVGQAKKRIAELDRIFKRIYEDEISGTISHERFLKLSAEYEAEQKELTEKVKADREMVNAYEQDKTDFDSFAAVIRKYVGITELTPTIVNEFVKEIIVHAPDKSSGHRRQKIQIIWNFVGELKQDEDKQTIERQRKSRTA